MTLLLVHAPGDDELAERIEAELSNSEWRIVHVGPDAALGSLSLAERAQAKGAVAAMRFDAARDELDLWVLDSDLDGASTDRIASDGSDERVLALRAVETLRARMLARARDRQVASAPAEAPQPENAAEPARARPGQPAATVRAPGSEPAPTEPELRKQPVRRSYPGLWLELAPAVTYSPGGLAPAAEAWLGVRLQPTPLWSVAGFVLVPIWSAPLQSSEGSAHVSALIFGSGLFLSLVRTRIELALGGGFAGVVALTSGEARAPYAGTSDAAFAPALFASPSLHLGLGAGLRAYLRPLVGAALPRLDVRFGSESAARWGAPFFACSLGIELALLGE